MHPTTETSAVRPEPIAAPFATRRLAGPAIATLVVIALAATVFLASRPFITADPAVIDAAKVRDGWSSYLGGAAVPAAIDATKVRDGWSSYLLVPEDEEASVTDGWSSYLLVSEPAVMDGWMSRYGNDD